MKNLFSIFLLFVIVALCGACSKEKNCRCQVTDVDDHQTVTSKEVIINASGVKCEDITDVGDEWMAREGFNSSHNKVACAEE